MADSKLTALTATTTPATSDILYIVTTPGGTPASKKVTIADVKTAMGGTFLIEEKSPNGSTATETFSAIPGTYRDLVLIIHGRTTSTGSANNAIYVQFNGDTAANYDSELIYVTATTPGGVEALATANPTICALPQTSVGAGIAGSGRAEIPYYANTSFNKVAISEYASKVGTSSGNVIRASAAVHWRNSAAITSILVGVATSGNFASGTKIALFGIA